MTAADFAHLLTIGLGRAVLHLEQHDPAPYRQAILDAARYGRAYDPQSEDTREDYLVDLIDRAGAAAWFREQLLAALTSASDDGLHGGGGASGGANPVSAGGAGLAIMGPP